MYLDKESIFQKSFWQSLNQQLSIEQPSKYKEPAIEFSESIKNNLKVRLIKEGYFDVPNVNWDPSIKSIEMGIKNLYSQSIPVVFAFIYDELWILLRQLKKILAVFLDDPVMRLPDIWVWFLDPVKDDKGWEPHRDKGKHALFSDGSPKSLTIWIPITDATALNGCIYILPKHLDSAYNKEDEYKSPINLQHIRALPAAAGSLLCWDQAVMHWSGTASSRCNIQRISISCEYQRADIPPFKQPLQLIDDIPSYTERLKLIARQIIQYRHLDPIPPGWDETLLQILNLE